MFQVYLAYADQTSSHYHEAKTAPDAERMFRALLADQKLRGRQVSAVLCDAQRPLYAVRLDGPIDIEMELHLCEGAHAR